jgi:AraC-like DNA-binding protein
MVVFSDAGGKEFFETIHEIGNNSVYSAAEKHKKVAIVFHELLQHLYDKFYGQKCLYTKETVRVKEYLDENVTRNISLKELGDLVYLSESQVVRIFKRDLGKTPHEYCLERKLEEAEKLLKNTHLMVREIADYLGFCDEHYFSYIFKKKIGKTPLEYRRRG